MRKRPLLIIDVDTGDNTKDQIEVYKEDEPALLAVRFCQKHDYDDATAETLRLMIAERLANALSKYEAKKQKIRETN